ncbi:MAG: class I SAM-dependent methyltransferase [Acidimicrobiia bacterium]|nr:class I SAM-dependent methyltransferase [Acidimicrobiia bacterium]MDX2468729.1 class I SAM-dependent methyltransferase [Acidimicrobiia bacterium]
MLNPYERSAEVYDLYYGWLDYSANAELIHDVIEYRKPGAHTLLDVACGTARYTEQMSRWYDVAGFDISESMLSVAHRRMPKTPFHLADMMDFDLGERFDALICMFSSIGYVTSLKGLSSMIRSCARHLNPGGVLVIEPWFGPEAWTEQHVSSRVVEGEGLAVARVDTSVRDGNSVNMRWAWAVAWDDGDADAYVEEHSTGLFTVDQYATLLAAAGLTAEYDPAGPLGRGLHIAVKT